MEQPQLPPLTPATLYLVATPIGNLEDITLRALRVLKECDVVAAEDTRRSGQLLKHFGITKPLLSYFQFNEAKRSEEIIERLRRGEKIALVTDAGSPGISDPGERVVKAAIAAGFRVEKRPGFASKREMLTASLPVAEESHPSATDRHAVVVGAGIAGCWTAHRLARRGWSVHLIERPTRLGDGVVDRPEAALEDRAGARVE